MKKGLSSISRWMICGIAFALLSAVATQAQEQQGKAKVVRIKGKARYSVAGSEWKPLHVGDVLQAGTVIQTASKSRVDFITSDGEAPPSGAKSNGDNSTYAPTADQNSVRIMEDSALAIDKFTRTQTGTEPVVDVELDLQRGRVLGNIKKMTAGSKFEVKIPNGVCGIRGTAFDIRAEGVITVYTGSVVVAYVGSDGNPVTQVVVGNQMFDARTGTITPIPPPIIKDGMGIIQSMTVPSALTEVGYPTDHTLKYVSPK
jgi:hypothetical protein